MTMQNFAATKVKKNDFVTQTMLHNVTASNALSKCENSHRDKYLPYSFTPGSTKYKHFIDNWFN